MNTWEFQVGRFGAECCVGRVPLRFANYWSNKPSGELATYLHEENWSLSDDDSELLQSLPSEARLDKSWFDVDDIEHLNYPFINDDNHIVVFDCTDVDLFAEIYFPEKWVVSESRLKRVQTYDDSDDSVIMVTTSIEKAIYVWELKTEDDKRKLNLNRVQFHTINVDDDYYLSGIDYKGRALEYKYTEGSVSRDFIAYFND